MAFQQLPGQLVLNFFIKNTFINIIDFAAQEYDEGHDVAEARRSRSAPPRMRSFSTNISKPPSEEDAVTENKEVVHANSKETSGQRPGDESDDKNDDSA